MADQTAHQNEDSPAVAFLMTCIQNIPVSKVRWKSKEGPHSTGSSRVEAHVTYSMEKLFKIIILHHISLSFTVFQNGRFKVASGNSRDVIEVHYHVATILMPRSHDPARQLDCCPPSICSWDTEAIFLYELWTMSTESGVDTAQSFTHVAHLSVTHRVEILCLVYGGVANRED